MNCHEIQDLLHGYLDDELDVVSSLAIEQHLQDCARCVQTYNHYQALRSADILPITQAVQKAENDWPEPRCSASFSTRSHPKN